MINNWSVRAPLFMGLEIPRSLTVSMGFVAQMG